jgi:hypothetical protein
MTEWSTLTDTDRLCTTLCPESDSLLQSLTESIIRSLMPFLSETGILTSQLEGCFKPCLTRARVGGA